MVGAKRTERPRWCQHQSRRRDSPLDAARRIEGAHVAEVFRGIERRKEATHGQLSSRRRPGMSRHLTLFCE